MGTLRTTAWVVMVTSGFGARIVISSGRSWPTAMSSGTSLLANPGASAVTLYGPAGRAAEKAPDSSARVSKAPAPANRSVAETPFPTLSETLPRTLPVATLPTSTTSMVAAPPATIVEVAFAGS